MRSIVLAALLTCAACKAQDTAAVDLKLAGHYMDRAAWHQNTAVWVFMVGSVFTYVASRPDHRDDGGDNIAAGIGAVTLGMTGTFMLRSNGFNRKAARVLREL